MILLFLSACFAVFAVNEICISLFVFAVNEIMWEVLLSLFVYPQHADYAKVLLIPN